MNSALARPAFSSAVPQRRRRQFADSLGRRHGRSLSSLRLESATRPSPEALTAFVSPDLRPLLLAGPLGLSDAGDAMRASLGIAAVAVLVLSPFAAQAADLSALPNFGPPFYALLSPVPPP